MSYCHGLGGNQVCLAFFIPCSSKLRTQITHIYSVLLTILYIIVQVFAYTKRQQIMSDDNCLDASSPEGPVKLVRCHGMGGNQAWTYSTQVFVLPLHCFCFYDYASKHIVFTQTNNVAQKMWIYIIEVCACTGSVETSLSELMFCAGYWVIYCTLFHNLQTSFPMYFVKSFMILLRVYENCSWWTILLSTWSVHKNQAFSLKNWVGTSLLYFLFVLFHLT